MNTFDKTEKHSLFSIDYADAQKKITIPGTKDKSKLFLSKFSLLFVQFLVIVAFSIFWTFNVLQYTPEQVADIARILKKKVKILNENKKEEEDGHTGEDAVNIMVLGPPWNYMRDVVMDLPVPDEDITFFWSTENSPGGNLQSILDECYKINLQRVRNDDVINLNTFHRTKGIVSSDIRNIAAQFTETSYGRMFSFFRHPYGVYLRKKVMNKSNTKPVIDNPMVRMVLNLPEGKINFKLLGIAKKVIREKCVVGLLDENINQSVKRIASYLGFHTDTSSTCVDYHIGKSNTLDPDGELMEDGSEDWAYFIKYYHYDLQLYEFARSVFRAQEQTIISRDKQKNE